MGTLSGHFKWATFLGVNRTMWPRLALHLHVSCGKTQSGRPRSYSFDAGALGVEAVPSRGAAAPRLRRACTCTQNLKTESGRSYTQGTAARWRGFDNIC